MISADDIIAAPATPPGRGAVAVVRVSGPDLSRLIGGLTGRTLEPRHAHYLAFRDAVGGVIDRGLALFFPAPRSYTGEDLLELHCHGSPAVLETLLRRLFQLGARPAEPGEFTRRAFLNGKLDLAQAEAVAALIESSSAQAVRAAQRSLEGEFSRLVHALTEALTRLRIQVEAAIDFSDEDIEPVAEGEVRVRLQAVLDDLADLRRRAHQGRLLEEGMTVVIAGPPNVGKSSLLNRLARREAAIVTGIAGTTRDLLRERILIDGMPLHVVDTAGLRASEDPVEQEGIRRAREALEQCDRILLVCDARDPAAAEALLAELPADIPVTRIVNKIDLTGQPSRLEGDTVWLSARTGAGLDLLCQHFKTCMGFEAEAEDALGARRRHLEALERSGEFLRQALAELAGGQMLELVAENLRLAQNALGEITGAVTSDDLLGRIFSEFCIGK